MDYNEYQLEAAKTAIYPKGRALEYVTLGLLSEVGELAGKYLIAKKQWFQEDWNEVIKELGDVFWYVSEFTRILDITLGEDFGNSAATVESLTQRSRGFTVVAITEHAGEVASAVKKFIRDSEDLPVDELIAHFMGSIHEQRALGHLRALITQSENLADILGVSMEAVLTQNITKLKARQDRGVLGGSGDNR